jgi:hypothetical protein
MTSSAASRRSTIGLADEIAAHGFVEVDCERLSLGFVAIHMAASRSD